MSFNLTKRRNKVKKYYICLFLVLVVSFLVNAQTPQYYTSNSGTSSNSFPFNMPGGKAVNSLILAGEFNQPSPLPSGKQINKVYFRTSSAGSRTFTDLRILMAQDVITTLTSGTFYSGPYDTVYYSPSVTLNSTTGGWMSITLDHPFSYNPTKSLIIFVGQCVSTGSSLTIYNSTNSDIRRVWSVGGCPFAPYASGDASLVNFGVDVSDDLSNRGIVLPTPGTTANYVSIPNSSAMTGFQTITIEAWVKLGGASTPNTILNKGAASYDYQFGVNSSTTNFVYLRAGSTVLYSTFTVPVGVWTHLAVTSSGSTVIFYMNGIPLTTLTSTLTLGNSSGELRIGRGDIDPGSGKIDEVRLWNIERSAYDIYWNMCNKWVPNTSYGLLGKWHLDGNLIDSVSGYNGTAVGSVTFDTTISCILSGIKNIQNGIPDKYQLEQNYPNPFNPSTTIKFSIPKDSYVELKIYDVSGKEVSSLISDPYKAGTYQVDFNASNFTSGVYFYKIVAGNFSMTKKMILIK